MFSIRKKKDNKVNDILRFRSEYEFLSNFYNSPLEFKGKVYKTSEHAYQAQKANNAFDMELVRNAATPGAAKRLGNQIKSFSTSQWDRIKVDVMKEVVLAKFSQNPSLKSKLISTGSAQIIEENDWNDTFWGVDVHGAGNNVLGKILMQVRDEIGKPDQK